ncbi:MAG: hypothetical protein K6G29_10605 [Clostridiales bacterium]|nr:hypothetical protein [Clostridiales bacterium]
MNRKILSFFLAVLLALTSVGLSACSEKPADTGNTPAVTSNQPEADVSGEIDEDEDSFIPDELPEKDFGGAVFSILTTTWYTAKNYIYADEMNGEVVNDALFNQRSKISDRFNLEIACTANDNESVVSTNAHTLVVSGDDSYHIVYNHDNLTMNNGLKGDFCNLRDFEVLDFSKPWWQGASQVFTIQNKLFATANPMAMSGIYMNCSVSFNKKLMSDLQLEAPYEKVRNGEWYIDDMISMAEVGMRDLDGNGKLDAKDQWGFLTASYGWLQFQSDLGAGCMEKDEEGNVRFTGNVDKMVSVMEKFDALDEFTQTSSGTDYNVQMFAEGRGLFMFSENRNLYESMRDTDISYGILPAPKFDELQENYASAGYDIYWGVLLSSSAHEELISYCLESISCENYNNVIPAVWEAVLGSKLADAPEDTEMFYIIRDVQYVDLGYALSQSIAGLGSIVFLKTNTTAGQTASFIQKLQKSLSKGTDRLNKSYAELGG